MVIRMASGVTNARRESLQGTAVVVVKDYRHRLLFLQKRELEPSSLVSGYHMQPLFST